MKRIFILAGCLLVCTAFLLLLPPRASGHALPEYAAQTGEPCSSCHISASGGGPRTPRGQGWVASSKPSVVPSLVDSLELLGVELNTDSTHFTNTGTEIKPAEPLQVKTGQGRRLFQWLSQYGGT